MNDLGARASRPPLRGRRPRRWRAATGAGETPALPGGGFAAPKKSKLQRLPPEPVPIVGGPPREYSALRSRVSGVLQRRRNLFFA